MIFLILHEKLEEDILMITKITKELSSSYMMVCLELAHVNLKDQERGLDFPKMTCLRIYSHKSH